MELLGSRKHWWLSSPSVRSGLRIAGHGCATHAVCADAGAALTQGAGADGAAGTDRRGAALLRADAGAGEARPSVVGDFEGGPGGGERGAPDAATTLHGGA